MHFLYSVHTKHDVYISAVSLSPPSPCRAARTDTACSHLVYRYTAYRYQRSVTAAGCVLQQRPVLPAVTRNVVARVFLNLTKLSQLCCLGVGIRLCIMNWRLWQQ